jgi:hypothetical protein
MDNNAMGKIIQLVEYKTERSARASFQPWCRFFNETFDARTMLGDLSASTLRHLTQPGETATALIYDLILGLLGFGEHDTFETLGKAIQMQVIDIHLFISDQIRFEMMRRLGWLSELPADHYPIADMISNFSEMKVLCQQSPPVLAPAHPQYEEYTSLVDRDRQVLIRRLLPSALEAFTQTKE